MHPMRDRLIPKAADSICRMDLYGQDAELYLLSRLLKHLDRRTMIDVGAERGSMAEGMLDAGVESLHALDADPGNAGALRAQFASDTRVRVHECAVSDDDGDAKLHLAANPDGSLLPFGHTLLDRTDTDEIAWGETIPVTRRSLQSLVDARELPSSIGILKIDTEGHDLAVVRGMGGLTSDVVMVEHWTNLPHGLGPCPWTAQDMLAELQPRGFSHFAFVLHRGEFVTLKWDDAEVETGAMGNLIFLHERVLATLMPEILDVGSRLAEQAVRIGQRYMRAAADRLALVVGLEEAAAERLSALEVTTARIKVLEGELEALRSQRR
jgi:FkbM family methyltransferase